jgi:hypothetical protein
MELHYFYGDDGAAYMVKGHVDSGEFMASLRKEVGADDPILNSKPEHCWKRYMRDFEEERTVIGNAKPNARGAFRATWIEA